MRSVADYDASARATIRVGKRFTYRDPDTGEPRVGYFAMGSGKLTILQQDEAVILSHFIPGAAGNTCEAYRNRPTNGVGCIGEQSGG